MRRRNCTSRWWRDPPQPGSATRCRNRIGPRDLGAHRAWHSCATHATPKPAAGPSCALGPSPCHKCVARGRHSKSIQAHTTSTRKREGVSFPQVGAKISRRHPKTSPIGRPTQVGGTPQCPQVCREEPACAKPKAARCPPP